MAHIDLVATRELTNSIIPHCGRDGTVLKTHLPEKAYLSLGKTRYSFYRFCCSTDLQFHLRSIIFISSEGAYATFY